MTELKTLKDIEFVKLEQGTIKALDSDIRNKIKKEAIKWIKKDIEDYRNIIGVPIDTKINSICMIVIDKWMQRFNITEEDLK